jgi:hypothetical protein
MTVFSKLARVIRRDGFGWFVMRVVAMALNQKMEIQRAKDKAWNILSEKYHLTVAYGPLKGMQLSDDTWWSSNDKITQLLGIYECHVMDQLINFSKDGSERFIDLGAADGYFAVGMAYGNFYDNIYAFEINKSGQDSIKSSADLNHCSEKICIRGKADATEISSILGDGIKTSILIDIEGFEYELLDDSLLNVLQNHFVICELHPWGAEGGYTLEKSLIERASRIFNVKIIQRDCYNPNCFDEFKNLTDEERLIAVGEGRGKNMNWLVLTPKSN